jgi:hypothetical protein
MADPSWDASQRPCAGVNPAKARIQKLLTNLDAGFRRCDRVNPGLTLDDEDDPTGISTAAALA